MYLFIQLVQFEKSLLQTNIKIIIICYIKNCMYVIYIYINNAYYVL